jgi:hypothetical protein
MEYRLSLMLESLEIGSNCIPLTGQRYLCCAQISSISR